MELQPIGLEVVAGPAAGTMIAVDDELVIGRLSEGAGRLLGDEEISRSHARLARNGDGAWAIEDLGSTNGTFVNSLRISAPQPLAMGDTIELGATTLVVRELGGESDEAEPAEPPVTKPSGVVSVTPPRLELRLEVDYGQGTAVIMWDDAPEPIRLTHTSDGWRLAADDAPGAGEAPGAGGAADADEAPDA